MASRSLLRPAVRASLLALLVCVRSTVAAKVIDESSPSAMEVPESKLRSLQAQKGVKSDNILAKERKRKKDKKRARRKKNDATRNKKRKAKKKRKANTLEGRSGWQIVEDYFEAEIITLCGNRPDGSLDAEQTARVEKSFVDFFNLDAECKEESEDEFLEVRILEFMGSDNCMGKITVGGGDRRVQELQETQKNRRKRSRLHAKRRFRCRNCEPNVDAELPGADSNGRMLLSLPPWVMVETDSRLAEDNEMNRHLQTSKQATSTCPVSIVRILRANGFPYVEFVYWYRSATKTIDCSPWAVSCSDPKSGCCKVNPEECACPAKTAAISDEIACLSNTYAYRSMNGLESFSFTNEVYVLGLCGDGAGNLPDSTRISLESYVVEHFNYLLNKEGCSQAGVHFRNIHIVGFQEGSLCAIGLGDEDSSVLEVHAEGECTGAVCINGFPT